MAMLRRKDAKLIAAPETTEEAIPIIACLGIQIGSFTDWYRYPSRPRRQRAFYPSQLTSAIETGFPPSRRIKRAKLSHDYAFLITRSLGALKFWYGCTK